MKIMLILTFLMCSLIASAQRPTYYEATLKTTSGTHRGTLERAGNKYVEIYDGTDYVTYPAASIILIKLKSRKDTFGKRVGRGAASCAGIGAGSWNEDVNKSAVRSVNNPYTTEPGTSITDAPAYLLTGAAVGAIIGAIPRFKKQTKFRVNNDTTAFIKTLPELKRYTVYTQLRGEF